MKAKPRRFLLALTAICGMLLLSVQPAMAFELFARRLGTGAAQKCDACQKGDGACQKGAHQKGACQKGDGACQKGASQKGACQKGPWQKGGCDKGVCQKGGCDKGACQKGGCDNGACQKSAHQKLWGAHQKGAVQKGGKGKGGAGANDKGLSAFGPEAPLPPPIAAPTSA